MIERLLHLLIDNLGLTSTMFWSILQEIAEFLHSKVKDLSKNMLAEIINKCLKDFPIDADWTSKLVDIFKYQASILDGFGYDSFRFIHRTFQEYLAAKSIICFNGIQRSRERILEKIENRIGIPNWRVPLSMQFGISSKLPEENGLFNYILTQLLTNEQASVNTQ